MSSVDWYENLHKNNISIRNAYTPVETFGDLAWLMRHTMGPSHLIDYVKARNKPDADSQYEAFTEHFGDSFHGTREAVEKAAAAIEASEFYQAIVSALQEPLSEVTKWRLESKYFKNRFHDEQGAARTANVIMILRAKILELLGGEVENDEHLPWTEVNGVLNLPVSWHVTIQD